VHKAIIRRATIGDVTFIHKLVNSFAEKGLMLGRPLSNLYELVRDFYVADLDGEPIGCAALHVVWLDLAELKSLAVMEQYQRHRTGRALVEACVNEARLLGIKRIFVLTNAPEFFRRMDFQDISKEQLPHKVWADCVDCPKFPDCDEQALVLDLE